MEMNPIFDSQAMLLQEYRVSTPSGIKDKNFSREMLLREILTIKENCAQHRKFKNSFKLKAFLAFFFLRGGYVLKRLFDITLALVLITLCSPFFLIIAVLIRLETIGNVFYSERLVGRDGQIFQYYQFRIRYAHVAQYNLLQLFMGKDNSDDTQGRLFHAETNEVYTAVGHVLRILHLNKFPCLFNILLGDMSFMGPAPQLFHEMSADILVRRNQFHMVPGIASLGDMQEISNREWKSIEKLYEQELPSLSWTKNFLFLFYGTFSILLGLKI